MYGSFLTPFWHRNFIDNHPLGLRTIHPGDSLRGAKKPQWEESPPTFRHDFIRIFYSSAHNTNNMDPNDSYNRIHILVDGTVVQRDVKWRPTQNVTRGCYNAFGTSFLFDKHILNLQMYDRLGLCPHRKVTNEQLITLKYWYEGVDDWHGRLTHFRLNDYEQVPYEELVIAAENRFG